MKRFISLLLVLSSYSLTAQADRRVNLEQKIDNLLAQMTLEEKASLVHANGKFKVSAIERLGIHEMWMSDGPHGVRYEINRHDWAPAGWDNDYSTYLPHLTSVAASWDLEIAAKHGDVLGSEARHRQKDFILGPGINMARLPLYGRNFEYMGEDPILAAKLVVPQIKAIQANDVAATAKHYALNTQELNRTGVDARPDERTLREVYLPAFEAAVKEANVLAIMGAYNNYYGTNANQSKHLVMDILKGEWNYQGVLLTDWNVDINTHDAAMYGLDIEMGTDVKSYDDYFLAQPLIEAIRAGTIPEYVLDDKVRRVLRVQFLIGMMDKHRLSGQRNTHEHQQAAREIAEAGIVLLKNNGQLPLNTNKLKSVLVLGPNADQVHGLGGGSSEVKSLYEITPLQGLKNALGEQVEVTRMRARPKGLSPIAADYIANRHWTGTPAWNISYFSDQQRNQKVHESWIVNSQYQYQKGDGEFITLSGAVRPTDSGEHTLKMQANGSYQILVDGKQVLANSKASGKIDSHKLTLIDGKNVQFEVRYQGKGDFTLGWDTPNSLFNSESEYLSAAKQADAVIYFGGLSHADDREAIDRLDMKLPNGQDEVIAKLLKANPNTIIFMVAGSAVEMPWVDQANAIIWGWYGGMEAGNAFANVLTGKVNPSAKMPITLPAKLQHTAPIALEDYNAKDSLYKEGVFIGYRWFEQQKIDPSFVFGHGLSYTQFKLSDIQLTKPIVTANEQQIVTAKVTNTGKVAGAEVVQLYLHDKQASVERPYKELKGFAKVFLQPGESKTVNIKLNKRDLSFWDVKANDWLAEPGEFEVLLGVSSADIRLKSNFTYKN